MQTSTWLGWGAKAECSSNRALISDGSQNLQSLIACLPTQIRTVSQMSLHGRADCAQVPSQHLGHSSGNGYHCGRDYRHAKVCLAAMQLQSCLCNLLSSMCSRETGSMQQCQRVSLACHASACTALDEHHCLMRTGSQQCQPLPL